MEQDSRVRAVAMEENDVKFLGKPISAGDMVALKSQYHKQRLLALCTRQQSVVNQVEESTPQSISFSEIVRKSEDYKMCTSGCKVLKLSDVKREYLIRLQELGAPKNKGISRYPLHVRFICVICTVVRLSSDLAYALCARYEENGTV